ncbi:MAG: mucoidy inhibitor MuiA family protein, partial [Chitinophagales bacterium]
MKTIHSKITNVAVFADRAQISRMAKVTLEAGHQTIVFGALPQNIEENSLQVTGAGNALLKDVKLKTKHFTISQNEGIEELESEQLRLENEQKVLRKKIERLESASDLVENIAAKITTKSKKMSDEIILQPDKWLKMIEFHQTQLAKIDEETLSVQKEQYELQLQLKRINREISGFGEVTTKTQKQVHVFLEAKANEEVVLKLSYVVFGAAWYPVYDVRVNSVSNEIALTYKAMVSQRTGEDWEDVSLQLSTAKPHLSGEPPKQGSWFLSRYIPPKYNKKSRQLNAIVASSAAVDIEINEEMYMKREDATVDTKAASVVFGVGSKTTILSDNQAQQATILERTYKTEFVHIVVPAKSSHTYLKAKIINDSEYPLLKGASNIFMDNHFVAKSNIPFTAPDADFELGLGIDEAVKVEHKTLQNLRKTVGFIKNKSKTLYS